MHDSEWNTIQAFAWHPACGIGAFDQASGLLACRPVAVVNAAGARPAGRWKLAAGRQTDGGH
jgi:hypothetical protein